MSKVPMTVHGAQLLRDELKNLKSIDRPRVISAISEARAHGDLKENAEYHAAKEQQGFIEGRIKEIESKLANAQEVDINAVNAQGKVVFGSTVMVVDFQNDQEITYKIVGEDEADLKKGKISITSPLARSLIGKEQDDIIELKTPNGVFEYEIGEIRYG